MKKFLVPSLCITALLALSLALTGCGGGGGSSAPAVSAASGFGQVGASMSFNQSAPTYVARQVAQTTSTQDQLPETPFLYQDCGEFYSWYEDAYTTSATDTIVPVYLYVTEDATSLQNPLYEYASGEVTIGPIASACTSIERTVETATATRASSQRITLRTTGTAQLDNVKAGANRLLQAWVYTGDSQAIYISSVVPVVNDGAYTSGITVSPETTLAAAAAIQYAVDNNTTLTNVPASFIDGLEDAIETLFPDGFSFGEPVTPVGFTSPVTFTDAASFASLTTEDGVPWTEYMTELAYFCGPTASAYVDQARDLLFQGSVSQTDFNSAVTALDAALAANPNCPDANLLSAITDIGEEWNRVGALLTNPQSIFPIANYELTATTLGRAISPVLGGLPRTAATLDSSSSPSEIQAELESSSLAVLTGALAKLQIARTGINNSDLWDFSYFKDPANPTLGAESLDTNDVDLITGALQLTIGLVQYLMAYNMDLPSGYATSDPCPKTDCSYAYNPNTSMYESVCTPDTSNEALASPNKCAAADTNSDNVLTPAEILPPSPFGTFRSNGASYMTLAQANITASLTLLAAATENVLTETTMEVGGLPMTSALLADVQTYKHYVTELAASFGGTTTTITVPGYADCWTSMPSGMYTYYMHDEVADPTNNTDRLASCVFSIVTEADREAPMNLGALFSLSDIRSALQNYTISTNVFGNTNIKPSSSFIGSTMGGLFPSGMQSSWFDMKGVIGFNFMVTDTSGNPLNISSPTGITLTVGSQTFNASQAYSNMISFYWGGQSVPTASDYMSYNDLLGTSVTLTVPGYQPVTFTVYESYAYGTLALTPSGV